MPVHPTEACYCHLITSGLKNAERLHEKNDADLLWNEIWHMKEVNKILTDFILYSSPVNKRFDENEHERYWEEVRPDYMCEADRASIWEYYTGWSFLAHATRGHDFYDEIQDEMANMRNEYLQQQKGANKSSLTAPRAAPSPREVLALAKKRATCQQQPNPYSLSHEYLGD